MCGLAGSYAARRDSASETLLLAMAGELRHRGPDGVGLYVDGRFGMTNTRLAIVDLEHGDQPLSNESGRYWVMQNGEIYNYVELQQELTELGHSFDTQSDTEVIAHAYEEWGAACLPRLNGDFAFAVWDRAEEELFLARDRFGARPLFVSEAGGAVSFASEVKALLRHPALTRQLDLSGLVECLTTWGIAPDRSAFAGVRELAPAHFLRAGPDGIREEARWWDLDFDPVGVATPLHELAAELLELLSDAVRIRLRADVPVGAYLSGGLDSSLLTALARSQIGASLQAFGIGFADEAFDESQFQAAMATALRTDLNRVEMDVEEIGALFPRVVALAEQPLLRTAPAPMLRLSGAVADAGLKVVLTGEGADELFGGYDLFREDRVRRFWARDPESQLRPLLLQRLYPYLASSLGRSGAFLRAFFARTLHDVDDPLFSHRVRFENGARTLRLLAPDVLEQVVRAGEPRVRLAADLPADFHALTPLARAQYLEVKTFLTRYLLHQQGDRMLMGHSIEGRFPYLDHRVAEFAARLPDGAKLRGLREKQLLREASRELVPDSVRERVKRPYRAPIAGVFAGPGKPEYVRELLRSERLRSTGLFSPEAVSLLLAKCDARVETGVSETDEMALTGVVSTLLLHEQFVASPALAAQAPATRVVVGGEAQPSLRG